ncbi:1,5-anhydro-D-fructose reductase [Pirellulimonas nuda]|uniref:1,5-anhydro-D-fructose reductase n=1 Tax=Pirellulimonas nuda TaxID=2528009 RepID=A0A518DBT3_9BACT|nr:Gfo/Idh/MocA family oxidoreductase [Pirellulimonas nuda]QDU88920.1 1,5-anhydro-D-fructose reductase [Pirellulimonas nuda]
MVRPTSRRDFLKTVATATAVVGAPTIIPSSALGRNGVTPPSERITVGGIGVGNRGRTDLRSFLNSQDARFVATCDAQRSRGQIVKQMVDKHYNSSDCVVLRRPEELLGRDDIDAVLIATGDRWHTMASILAARAGKDIYCEKPCSMTIEESLAFRDAVIRYGRIYQAGTQRRTIPNFQFAVDLVHSGKLGQLRTMHAHTLDPAGSRDWLPAQPQPGKDEIDWDLWLGPAPWRPYNALYAEGRWRGYHDLHSGGILEWGAHTVDLCQWANRSDDTVPVEYEPWDTNVTATYANGVKLVMRDRDTGWLGLGTCPVRFEGDEGWVETGDSGKFEVYPESLRSEIAVPDMRGTDPSNHVREFLDCVRSRKACSANERVAAQSHIASHAATIAWRMGETLRFDPAKNAFVHHNEANRHLARAVREPWRI